MVGWIPLLRNILLVLQIIAPKPSDTNNSVPSDTNNCPKPWPAKLHKVVSLIFVILFEFLPVSSLCGYVGLFGL